mmetsp:Transcript_22008/g.38742  ORF Transcript_22008/g.38742 Transcript_22008/m.38742 type:complete len:191 (-) Transcript_22008:16-588(-)
MPRRLVLLRHGQAVPEAEDPERPLTADGRSAAAATAIGVTTYLGAPRGDAAILHSGKVRACQTADAVRQSLSAAGWTCTFEEAAGLNPKDPPLAAAELVEKSAAPVLIIVGHLPHMGLFSARLVGEPAAAGELGRSFVDAGGLALQQADGAESSTAWVRDKFFDPVEPWWEAPADKSATGETDAGTEEKS